MTVQLLQVLIMIKWMQHEEKEIIWKTGVTQKALLDTVKQGENYADLTESSG